MQRKKIKYRVHRSDTPCAYDKKFAFQKLNLFLTFSMLNDPIKNPTRSNEGSQIFKKKIYPL